MDSVWSADCATRPVRHGRTNLQSVVRVSLSLSFSLSLSRSPFEKQPTLPSSLICAARQRIEHFSPSRDKWRPWRRKRKRKKKSKSTKSIVQWQNTQWEAEQQLRTTTECKTLFYNLHLGQHLIEVVK